MCFGRIARKVPINYIILMILTACESYTLSLTVAQYEPRDVFQTFLLTAISFLGMSLYAMSTRKDLSIYGSVVAGSAFCMITIGILMIFFSAPWLRMLYSGAALWLALVFVAVDTQLILKKRKHGIGYDDFVRASAMLYIDFINLFIHIISLFGGRRNRL